MFHPMMYPMAQMPPLSPVPATANAMMNPLMPMMAYSNPLRSAVCRAVLCRALTCVLCYAILFQQGFYWVFVFMHRGMCEALFGVPVFRPGCEIAV